MDEMERNTGSFSLEDILKEFGDAPQDIDENEEILIWDGMFPEQSHADAFSAQDTVRLDEITKAVREQAEKQLTEEVKVFEPVGDETVAFTPANDETVAFTPVNDETVAFTPVNDQTMAFTPVGGEEEEEIPAIPQPQEPPVEPYSEEWEPEYEQPIGEYIPPEPIIFRPKSRLWELKRKLVAGPEKRYYELSELGLGKLQAAILGNLLVAVMSAVTTAMYTVGMIGQERTRFVIFIQFLSLLLSALLGSYQLMEGFTDILKKRFSLNSLLLFSLAACLLDGILCLQQVRIPCSAAFSLNMTMSLWSAYQKRNTEMGQMDTMRKATCLYSVVSVPDYHDGHPGFLTGEGQVEDFMDTYQETSGPEKTLSVYALIVLLVSLVIGVAAGVLYGLTGGVQVFSAALLVAVPATSYITISRPMAILERRLHKLGTVFCGWSGIKALSAAGAFPVGDHDLFPAGAAKMNGVKFYGQRDPDDVVAYAAALMETCGGGMAPLFSQLLESRNGYHYEAENFRGYSGGVGAVINEEAVLAGSLSFMQEMGVDMPEGTRVSQAIYLSIDGQLSGVFAISYAKTKPAATGLTTLCAYSGLTPVLTCDDFMITESFLRAKFGVNTRRMAFPDRSARKTLAEKLPDETAEALALTTQEGLASTAYAVTGARALRTAIHTGVAVHMLGGILGLLIMLVLGLLHADYLLTPANVVLYELVWMIPGLLITEWTRSV